MEGRVSEQFATIPKLMEEMATLRPENIALQRGDGEPEGDQQSHNSETRRPFEIATAEEERRRVDLQFQKLENKCDKVVKRVGLPSTMDQLLTSAELPYSAEVMVVPLPPRFKVPQINVYDRSKDPLEYLKTFKAHMTLHGFPSEVTCRAFPLIMKGAREHGLGPYGPGPSSTSPSWPVSS